VVAVQPIKFDPNTPALATDTTVHEWYKDPSGSFSAGFWAGREDCFEVRYTEHEFCHLIEGTVRLTDALGDEHIFRAGDSFVIPAGFNGSWQTCSPVVRKFYVIYEAKG
jgi:uncharacterized cupin superfamily protein